MSGVLHNSLSKQSWSQSQISFFGRCSQASDLRLFHFISFLVVTSSVANDLFLYYAVDDYVCLRLTSVSAAAHIVLQIHYRQAAGLYVSLLP